MENPKTATELLMAVADRMRQYGDGLEDVLVVWNTSKGVFHVKANCNDTRALGLAIFGVREIHGGCRLATTPKEKGPDALTPGPISER